MPLVLNSEPSGAGVGGAGVGAGVGAGGAGVGQLVGTAVTLRVADWPPPLLPRATAPEFCKLSSEVHVACSEAHQLVSTWVTHMLYTYSMCAGSSKQSARIDKQRFCNSAGYSMLKGPKGHNLTLIKQTPGGLPCTWVGVFGGARCHALTKDTTTGIPLPLQDCCKLLPVPLYQSTLQRALW